MKKNKLATWGITIVVLTGLGAGAWFNFLAPKRYNTPIILKGTVVTPDEIIDPGWIVISSGKIQGVSTKKPVVLRAIEIDTRGIIFPGLINLHDHVVWNIIPRWDPNRLYLNRYEWRDGDDDDEIGDAVSGVGSSHACEMNTYGEVRALAGGTTSILGTWSQLCIGGLVRNLDYFSGFYTVPLIEDRNHIKNTIDLPLDPSEIEQFLATKKSEASFIHLAEGRGPAMRAEFDQLVEEGLLTDKTVIIHGVALEPDQFELMSQAGASLIWSPRSNLELYGQTADIASALEADVMVAIGPDWAITGSSNILDELHLAAEWNSSQLNNLLSPQQLVEMVTRNPAVIAGISEEVGTIQEGKYADLLVISGDPNKPYRALINSGPDDVMLVFVNGVPVYGARELMESLWKQEELSPITILGKPMSLHFTNFSTTVAELETALGAYGYDLASIAESTYTLGSLPGIPAEDPVGTPLPNGEINWQDAIHYFGENKTVCGPVIGAAYAANSSNQPTYLNIGEPYPSIHRFTAIIWGENRENFPGNPENEYANKTVCVSGEIVSYRGVAHIFITTPREIEISSP